MNQITDSATSDPTMAASIAFNTLLDQIRGSNLNFQMHLSPFSANISLKNTLIKDKSGAQLLPPATLFPFNDVKTENMEIMLATNRKLEEDISALRNKLEEVLAKNQAAQIEINNLKENLSSMEKNSKNEVKEKKAQKKLRQKAQLKADKVLNKGIGGITEFGRELPHLGPDKCTKSVKPSSTPPSPQTPSGTPPPPGPSQAYHHTYLPVTVVPPLPPPDLPARSSPLGSSPETDEAETETVLFEGKLISKQDALKKILEAVQDVNKNFNP